jgi:HK97 family phage prohead protease
MHTEFRAATEGDDKYIEGYFVVFDSNYEMWQGASESVAPTAFDGALMDDIRCLIDHETRLVLGRTKPKTLELKVDTHGLWGRVKINPLDQDAMNLYARVERGDVDQCSFGFDILDEEMSQNGDVVHWTIKSVKLYEVSVVTFPAYEDTAVAARKQDFEQIKKRGVEKWRAEKMGVLHNGT